MLDSNHTSSVNFVFDLFLHHFRDKAAAKDNTELLLAKSN